MRLVALIAWTTLLSLAGFSVCDAQDQSAARAAAEAEPASTVAQLYVFNDSGRTLFPSNQAITDNGKKLVSLPRQTYTRLELQPGPHLLKPDPPLWKQQVLLNVVAGSRYFVVIAYKPERSWASPLAGAPLLLTEITEEQAALLLKEMKQK